MTETAGLDRVRSAEQIGLSARKTICVDSKRQWRHADNIWHNSMIRSVLQTIAAPLVGLAHLIRRDQHAT